jgi:hypothetical protein
MLQAPSAPVNVRGKFVPAQGLVRHHVVITWDRPSELNGIIRKYTIVYYYDMDKSNKKIVNINKTSDLKYTLTVTWKRILSYNISASTIKEGPFRSGKNLIPSSYSKFLFTLILR